MKTAYNDGGFSGGTMERPAVKRLMADLKQGLVDIVVVYKVDRLTRSLADFAKIVEILDGHGASFVSITQQFNTTSSMGRLTLNVLLSFAQFEREVTGERIRDKIAASKRKGMWMGGVPPIGYDVKDRRLVVNEREAKVVRQIFKRFAELGSSTKLVKEMRLDGITSKAWTTQEGIHRAGKLIDKGMVYKIIGNRTYLGDLRHKDEWFKGAHQPLIEPSMWEAVQSVLKVSPRLRGNNTRATIPFLLKGIVEGPDGRAFTVHWARKGTGRLYRYYIHTRENKEFAGASGLPRLPAMELEATVVEQMRRVLRAPDLKFRVAAQVVANDSSADEGKVCIAMLQIDKIWEQLFPAEQERIVRLLIKKVIVTPHNIEVQFRPNGIERLASEVKLPTAANATEKVAA